MTHTLQSDLALYSTGDLPLWRRPLVRMHLADCDGCRSWVAAFDSDRESVRRLAAEMPQGVNWDRMAAEMSANVRVGLEAGECVASRVHKPKVSTGWRVAAASAGVAILLVTAWWLNMPRADTVRLYESAPGATLAFFDTPGDMTHMLGHSISHEGFAIGEEWIEKMIDVPRPAVREHAKPVG